MTTQTKIKITRPISIVGSVVGVLCILQIQTLGMASSSTAKLLFIILLLDVILTLSSTIAFFYYRAYNETHHDTDDMAVNAFVQYNNDTLHLQDKSDKQEKEKRAV